MLGDAEYPHRAGRGCGHLRQQDLGDSKLAPTNKGVCSAVSLVRSSITVLLALLVGHSPGLALTVRVDTAAGALKDGRVRTTAVG